MANFTTRLGLTKPTGAEARSVTPLNTNADLIDKFLPCILVNDGVTPPTGDLYDGVLVKERNSGIIWEARKNGGGTYDKIYVSYPYQMYIFGQVSVANATHTVLNLSAANFNSSKSVNASTAQINGSSEFVIPIKGIWRVHMHYSFDVNATGLRAAGYKLNGTLKNGDADEANSNAVNGTNTKFVNIVTDSFSANDTLIPDAYQTSGGNLLVTCFFIATLIQPRP